MPITPSFLPFCPLHSAKPPNQTILIICILFLQPGLLSFTEKSLLLRQKSPQHYRFRCQQEMSLYVSSLHGREFILGFPGGSDGEESPAVWETFPGLGRSPGRGHGNPFQYSCLENPHGQRSLARYSPWGGKELTQLSN